MVGLFKDFRSKRVYYTAVVVVLLFAAISLVIIYIPHVRRNYDPFPDPDDIVAATADVYSGPTTYQPINGIVIDTDTIRTIRQSIGSYGPYNQELWPNDRIITIYFKLRDGSSLTVDWYWSGKGAMRYRLREKHCKGIACAVDPDRDIGMVAVYIIRDLALRQKH